MLIRKMVPCGSSIRQGNVDIGEGRKGEEAEGEPAGRTVVPRPAALHKTKEAFKPHSSLGPTPGMLV